MNKEYTNKNWPKEKTQFDVERISKAVQKRLRKRMKQIAEKYK